AVRYIGKASTCLSVSIHAPGLGRRSASAGTKPISRNGSARPRPNIRNIASAIHGNAVKANASAPPMNGAMHGLATTQASTPVKKSPAGPLRDASAWPTFPIPPPSVNTPDRLSPTANIRYTSAATNQGCCSWKPHPSAWPPARRASTSAPIAANATSTPAVYQSAWRRACARLSPLCARPSTLSERIGSTQGIRLSTSPPSRASNSAPSAPPAGRALAGSAVRAALSAEASGGDGVGSESLSPSAISEAASRSGESDSDPDAAADPGATGPGEGDAGPDAAAPAGSATSTVRVIGG